MLAEGVEIMLCVISVLWKRVFVVFGGEVPIIQVVE